MTDERKHDFDSCTKDELTYCIKGRIKNIREIKDAIKILDNKCPGVHSYLILAKLNLKSEIRELMKMRRAMIANSYKHYRDIYNESN